MNDLHTKRVETCEHASFNRTELFWVPNSSRRLPKTLIVTNASAFRNNHRSKRFK
ncbi:hypothetical protein WN55_06973 [Dufourea novaeangliae]|uniref:Uncharacterized protein n=1 Tax=Dufourea novaeangliae TaxID=178035 RepID=A0A154PRI8_DUFNO|nr:hypothetical protein WN55_06973 [Dufourea novaeangliae]